LPTIKPCGVSACWPFFLLFILHSFTQQAVDRDSVRILVEQVIRQKQDSLKEAKQLQEIKKNSKSLDAFLQEMQEREKQRLAAGGYALVPVFSFFHFC
jgi:uncharacterized protein YdeI (YjbR/CyaY-like superfamily)